MVQFKAKVDIFLKFMSINFFMRMQKVALSEKLLSQFYKNMCQINILNTIHQKKKCSR